MKKNILAVAVATAIAAPAAMADAKIYGYFNTAVQNVTDNGTAWDDRNSRLGFKGSEDLGNGLKAIYQFETGVNINNGTWNGAKRNTFVGLNGGFGTVLMGRHDTPLRMIQPTDHFADASHAGTNRGNFQGGQGTANAQSGEQRLDNVLAYVSPSFNGVSFALAGVQGKGKITGGAGTDIDPYKYDVDDRNITNAISANVAYGKKSDGIYAAAAMTKISEDYGVTKDITILRVTGQYKADGLTANAMYNKSDAPADDHTSLTLGVAYDMDALTPKAKIAKVDNGTDDWMNMAIGLDYKLGKNTKAFVEYTKIAGEQGLNGTDDVSVLGFGMNHKF